MPKFIFRGKTWEEIQDMDLKEFLEIMDSRQRRSLKRGFTDAQKALLRNIQADRKKFHRTKSRQMIIIPEMVGVRIGVHSGKEYVPLDVKPEMLGRRLGEFVPTRRMVKHSAPGFGATKSSKFIPLK
ncbi:MAG: 30S ribosomal protein S19 [Candidatus Aenigmarchaeota archaeon]|nr:30S ribosomal protein S19 [Candidatus Aenigmarchaeota archaeon]